MQVVTSSPLLRGLSPSIAEILRISGAAGASIGILDGVTGETRLAGFGYRDVGKKLPPDEHTVYHIEPALRQRIPFGSRMAQNFSQTRQAQYLSHLILRLLHLSDQDGYIINWGYDLLSGVVAAVSGSTWADFVSERILKPLNLTETTTGLYPPGENWAHGYMPDPSCEPHDVGRPVIADGTVHQGSNGVKSTVHHLLIYYKAVIDTYRLETEEGINMKPDRLTHLLRKVKDLLTPYIPLDPDAGFETGGQWCGAGWAIAELPAPLGRIGTNGMFIDPMPLVGRGCESRGGSGKTKIWYHNGSLVGFFSSVHILSESGTIVVVLANSITKNDAPDWVGQLLVENLLDCKERNNYVALAKQSADGYDEMWRKLPGEMEKAKTPGSHGRPLPEYAGRYFNTIGNWFTEIIHDADGLAFSFQGRATQVHRLEIFGQDTFSWLLTEEQSRQRGR
ncbi:beta-lactamase/transpeptidase-like protein [Xylaria digitata]|nr:beta-lactamase/transpeptidase-like protein [Xylaria digitata]